MIFECKNIVAIFCKIASCMLESHVLCAYKSVEIFFIISFIIQNLELKCICMVAELLFHSRVCFFSALLSHKNHENVVKS